MQRHLPTLLLQSILILTSITSCIGLALPQGDVSLDYYTIVAGQESFLPLVVESSVTGTDNAGGPAVQSTSGQASTTVPCPTPTPVATAVVTVIPASALPTTNTQSVAVASAASTSSGNTAVFVQVTSLSTFATTDASGSVTSTSAVVTLTTLTTLGVGAAAASSAAATASSDTQGGIFLEGSATTTGTTVATIGASVVTLTTLGGMTNSISNVATATHTAIATGTVQLVCTGDSDALTTYEQANADGTPLTFVVTNQCDYSIWPEVSYREWPNSTDVTDFNIGELADGASYTWSAHPYWMTSARMWAKEGCDSSGENCVVDAGNAPTLFEFNIYPDASTCQAEIDYDISLVDGHTIPIAITFDSTDCDSRTCAANKTLGGVCPSADYNTIDGIIEGCYSTCSYLQRSGVTSGAAFELACCTGDYDTPETCSPTSPWFSEVCPEAYSYAYDDVAANRACLMPSTVTIAYCPGGVQAYS